MTLHINIKQPSHGSFREQMQCYWAVLALTCGSLCASGALQPEEAEEAAYEDILKIQVRRVLLEKWVNEPFFERTLPGTVVRVAMRGQYFMAEVIEVMEREEGTYRSGSHTGIMVCRSMVRRCSEHTVIARWCNMLPCLRMLRTSCLPFAEATGIWLCSFCYTHTSCSAFEPQKCSSITLATETQEVLGIPGADGFVCRDAGVPTPCPYPLERAGETRKWLLVQRGTSPRTMPMTLISNHHIEEDEFESWQRQCERDRRPQITLPEVDAVKARLKEAQSYAPAADAL